MLELQGKNNTAKVFTDNVNQETIGQIIKMLNEPITKNTQVRIMPDTHYGSGATVGTTIKLPDNRADWKISPAIVGTDMSCAMMSYKIAEKDIDLEQLDLVVNRVVPAGARIHAQPQNPSSVRKLFKKLSYDIPDKSLHEKNLGTLGGGNHFIELAKDEDGNCWLTVHSGSRSFGKTIAQHHQALANQKANARLPYLEGADLDAYLNDSLVAHEYAHLSRKTMLDNIVKEMNWTVTFAFDSVHNNVDIDNGIIRKGATSAQEGELLIIPLNMRDGSLICVGKGNPDWNASYRQFTTNHHVLHDLICRQEERLDELQSKVEKLVPESVRVSYNVLAGRMDLFADGRRAHFVITDYPRETDFYDAITKEVDKWSL